MNAPSSCAPHPKHRRRLWAPRAHLRMAVALAMAALASAGATSCGSESSSDGPGCDLQCCDPDGCGPPPVGTRCTSAEPPEGAVDLRIGTVDDEQSFTELTVGQSMPLDFGGQGGQHFYFAARAFGAPPGALLLARFVGDGGNRGSFAHSVSSDCGGEWFELDAYLPLDSFSQDEGEFTVDLGTCPESGCGADAQGNYVLTEVLGSATVRVMVSGSDG